MSNNAQRNLSILFGCSSMLLLLACDEGTTSDVDDRANATVHEMSAVEEISSLAGDGEGSHEIANAVAPEPFSIIDIDGGAKVMFIELVGGGGERSVGIAEIFSQGDVSAIEELDLANSTPLDVFYALSSPDAEIPSVLLELYGENAQSQGAHQGWGVGELTSDPDVQFVDTACDNTWFADYLYDDLPSNYYKYDDNGSEVEWAQYFDFSLPGSSGSCTGGSRKKYVKTVENVDGFRAATCINASGSHSWTCTGGYSGNLRPEGGYWYRDSSNNGWYNAFEFEATVNGTDYAARWYNNATNWDWQHDVRGFVLGYTDAADIHTGWQN